MKTCTGQLLVKSTPEELKEHYEFMLSSSRRELSGYIQSGVVSGKCWFVGRDKNVCEACRENQRAGVIPLDAVFPSGHLYPPAGELCRCVLLGQTDESA
jgi:hypothetical protein